MAGVLKVKKIIKKLNFLFVFYINYYQFKYKNSFTYKI